MARMLRGFAIGYAIAVAFVSILVYHSASLRIERKAGVGVVIDAARMRGARVPIAIENTSRELDSKIAACEVLIEVIVMAMAAGIVAAILVVLLLYWIRAEESTT